MRQRWGWIEGEGEAEERGWRDGGYMNKFEIHHSPRSQAAKADLSTTGTSFLSLILSNNTNFLLSKDSFDEDVGVFVRNTEIVFCGVTVGGVGFGFVGVVGLRRRDFFSVERGVKRGALSGSPGRSYSNNESIDYQLSTQFQRKDIGSGMNREGRGKPVRPFQIDLIDYVIAMSVLKIYIPEHIPPA